jgi:DNA-binding CsgD family transcriptional regulator
LLALEADVASELDVRDAALGASYTHDFGTCNIGDLFCCEEHRPLECGDGQRDRERFTRRVLGGEAGSYEISSLDSASRRVTLRIHSAPLSDAERVVGIFGIAIPIGAQSTPSPPHTLTRRQIEVLRLLADGANTETVAGDLGIALETARNHIRGLLRRLGVHSRIEAIAEGRRRGLLRMRNGGDVVIQPSIPTAEPTQRNRP